MADIVSGPEIFRRFIMSDRLTRKQRSILMAGVRTKHTGPELKVRSIAHGASYRFSLHRKDLPGRPDIVFPRYKSVVYVHACFWHQHKGCSKSVLPATRKDFWTAKLSRNVSRTRRTCGVFAEPAGEFW